MMMMMMKIMKRQLWLYDWTKNGNKRRHEEEVNKGLFMATDDEGWCLVD